MVIFLSAELYGKADSLWSNLERKYQRRLDALQNKTYGEELDHISIISIIMPEEFFEDGGWPERKLFKRKTKEADIRLRIDYKSFIRAKPEQREQIYKEHIIQSIETLRHKVSKAYKFDELIHDVTELLSTNRSGGWFLD